MVMSKIEFIENCPLMRYLKKASIEEVGRKSEFAGALLCGLGFPSYTRQLTDIAVTALLVQEIKKTKQTDLLFETKEKCVNCPHSDRCEVGALFKVS
jgi:hypothetical protein